MQFFLQSALGLALFQFAKAAPTEGSTAARAVDWWHPQAPLKWQIILRGGNGDLNISDAPVYDVDLERTSTAEFKALKENGKKIICYFSAGSYEDFRTDISKFDNVDLGNRIAKGDTEEEGYWEGEFWLNIKSANLLNNVMIPRIQMAKDKGCDGIDPDNVDGYGVDEAANGKFNPRTKFNLKKQDAIDYMTKLADEAHKRGLAIGLKNAGEIVPKILPLMDFAVNEQCAEKNECPTFKPFIDDKKKPVFQIEYPPKKPNSQDDYTLEELTPEIIDKMCAKGGPGQKDFSTIIKDWDVLSHARWCDGTSASK